MLIEKLIAEGIELADGRALRDIRVGVGYTAVKLEDGSSGVAYTFRNELGGHCGVLKQAGSLIGQDAVSIMAWLGSDELIKAAIGLATINAAIARDSDEWPAGNVIEALNLQPEDTFGMVGDFAPILAKVRECTKNIHVFERGHKAGSDMHPSIDIPEFLPLCDVVVVTATSVINHTIDDILKHCGSAREVCLTGPSTPIYPSVFADTSVTLLAGTVVTDSPRVLEIVSQAGGTIAMKPATRQVLVRV